MVNSQDPSHMMGAVNKAMLNKQLETEVVALTGCAKNDLWQNHTLQIVFELMMISAATK